MNEQGEGKRSYAVYLNAAIGALDRIEKEDEDFLKAADHGFSDVKDEIWAKINGDFLQGGGCKATKTAKSSILRHAVAGLIACVILLLFIFPGDVSAIKIKIQQLFVEYQEDHIKVVSKNGSRLENEVKKELGGWKDFYYPAVLPEGYALLGEKCRQERECKVILFSNNTEELCLIQRRGEDLDLQLDSENAQVERLNVQDEPGILIIKEERITLSWLHDTTQFQLIGRLPQEELVAIAESLFYIE